MHGLRFLFLLAFLAPTVLQAQNTDSCFAIKEIDTIWQTRCINEEPVFPGGYDSMVVYLTKNLHYPKLARRMMVQGRVVVSFVINKIGMVTDVDIVSSKLMAPDSDMKYYTANQQRRFEITKTEMIAEAKRVISAMPPWKPGSQNGKKVKARFILPITYKLI